MVFERVVRGVVAALVLAATGACTAVMEPGNPPMIVVNPIGSRMPTQIGSAAPPANLDPNPDMPGVMPALGGPRDGVYSGIAVPMDTAGGLCITSQPVDGFQVTGDRVRWDNIRGRIRGDNLQMVQGNTWVIGQFDENRFSGQIIMYGPRQTLGCTFALRLTKTGEL